MSKTVFSGAHKHLVRTLKDARKKAGLIIATDAERMLRRAKEIIPRPNILIAIHKIDDKLLNENFVNDVFHRLDARVVRIGPENWDAICQVVVA